MSGPNKPPAGKPRPGTTGILVLDKPRGISSMTAVAVVRRRAGGARTGHAGTLDPLATGVLVLALGRATKVIDRLMATDKRYRTEIDLAAFTSTDDLEGERAEVAVEVPPDEPRVRAVLGEFVGEISQRPPAFSAVKVSGRRAYKLARAGETVELPPRPATIHAIDLVRYDWPILEIDVHCAKGVYIRSLARDIGVALGTGGHCVSLRRTAVGPFDEAMAIALDDVPEPLTEADLIPIDEALAMVEG
jgi:tRNA pseudouridine55 synthase